MFGAFGITVMNKRRAYVIGIPQPNGVIPSGTTEKTGPGIADIALGINPKGNRIFVQGHLGIVGKENPVVTPVEVECSASNSGQPLRRTIYGAIILFPLESAATETEAFSSNFQCPIKSEARWVEVERPKRFAARSIRIAFLKRTTGGKSDPASTTRSPETERIATHGQQTAPIVNVGSFDPDRSSGTTGSR